MQSQAQSGEQQVSARLVRELPVRHVVGTSLAWVAPAVCVMIITPYIFAVGGTFAADAVIGVGLISVIPTALCLAELGSMFPSAGGMYEIMRRILPGPFGWVMALSTILSGGVALAIASLSLASYLKQLAPSLPGSEHLIALGALGLALALALVRAKLSAVITGVLICIEVGVLTTILLAAMMHSHRSVASVVAHPVFLSDGGITHLTAAAALATLPLTFALVSAYEAPLGYGEEIVGGTRALARAVIWTGLVTVVLLGAAVLATTVAAPDLASLLRSPSPPLYSVLQAFGPNAATFITAGIAIALFTTLVGGTMYVGRMIYATGLHGLWPGVLSRKLASINRHGVPGWAVTGLVVLLAVPLTFWGTLGWLVVFISALWPLMYALVGVAAIWARLKHPHLHRPFRMWLGYTLPVIVVAIMAAAFYYQETQYQVGVGILVAVSTGCWLVRRR